ncbi:Ig-like domain-containing protein, partial [Algoriphagus sp. C2-6-M1]|uniref:Ig-like domain-containing protein n=1 Tax=Algoriphagus persicinus TaxID=3108754 RepID=UPI002B393625
MKNYNNSTRKRVENRIIVSTLLLFLVILNNAFATEYYFSSTTGNDSRSITEAQNESTPWKSIDKLNSISSVLKGGDKIFFKSGDVFVGSILINKGGDAGNPITFTSYGSGAKPIITSLEPVTNWESIGGGIFEAAISNLTGDKIQVVLIDNVIRPMGRYPNADASNAGYLLINSVNNNYSINGDALPGDFSGGEVVIRKNNWIIDRHEIQSSSGSTINFLENTNTFYTPQKGFGYFVQNHKNALDQFGEWAYSKSTKKIAVYFGGQNPSNLNVQVAKREHLVINNSYVKNFTFRNLDFRGSNKNLLMIQKSGGVTVENCSLDFAGENAIFGSDVPDFIIKNNHFNRALSGAIYFWYGTPRTDISDNLIENSMPFQGMAKSSDLTGIGVYIAGDANNAKIERNRVLNTGYNGIHFGGNYTLVKNNLVDNFCLWKQDGGGIYTNSDGLTNMNNVGREVVGNIVTRGIGAQEGSSINYKLAEGIYIDDNAQGLKIFQNTISDINGKGIYLHNGNNIQILENTIYKAPHQIQVTHDYTGNPVRNVRIENNQFSSVYENEVAFSISSILDDINQIGVSDNNYYLDPFKSNSIFHSKGANEGAIGTKRNLPNWTETFGYDRNSLLPEFNLEKYKITSSSNVKSSNFDTDVNLIAGTYNGKSEWVSTGITAGTWKVTPTGTSTISAFIQIGATNSGDEFLIEFDTKSETSNKSVELLLEKTFNQNQEGNIYYFATSSGVQSVKILLKSKISTANESIVFRIPASIPSLLIDNLRISKVITEKIPVTEYVFFQYNYSSNAVTHSLNGVYKNAKGESFDRSVTIPAYGSALLAKVDGTSTAPINSPPSISIIDPIQDQSFTFGQDILIKTNASDPENKIQKVELFHGEQMIAIVNAAPYEFAWKNAPVGNYVLKAKIFDIEGLTAESARINISVISAPAVNQAPSVSIIDPIQDQSFTFGQDILIRTNASDPENKIQKVELFHGEQMIAIVNAAPYEFAWKNAPVGNYILNAKVFDDKGLTAECTKINISVISA